MKRLILCLLLIAVLRHSVQPPPKPIVKTLPALKPIQVVPTTNAKFTATYAVQFSDPNSGALVTVTAQPVYLSSKGTPILMVRVHQTKGAMLQNVDANGNVYVSMMGR